MTTVKVCRFPGETKEYTVDSGATVSEVLKLAGIEMGYEEEVKADGGTTSLDNMIGDTKMLIVTKRLKGAIR